MNNNQDPDFISILMSYMDPSTVFALGFETAWHVLPFAGLIMALSVLFRTLQEQANAAVASQVNWAKYFFDVILWGSLLSLYFAISIPIINFFNLLYEWAEYNGSFDTITTQIATTINALNNMPPPEDTDDGTFAAIWGALESAGGYIVYGGAFVGYLATFIVTMFLSSFLKVGHAFLFNLAFIWGLIVIPLNITNNIKLLRPWATFCGVILLWPFFLALMMFFFKGIFIGATNEMIASMDTYSMTAEASFYVAFSILNLFLCATLLVAPFVAQSFLTGSGMTASILSFASAGLASARMAYNMVAKPTSMAGAAAKGLHKAASSTTFHRAMQEMGSVLRAMKAPGGGGGGGDTPFPGGRGKGKPYGTPASAAHAASSATSPGSTPKTSASPTNAGQSTGASSTGTRQGAGSATLANAANDVNPTEPRSNTNPQSSAARASTGGAQSIDPHQAHANPHNVHSLSEEEHLASESSSARSSSMDNTVASEVQNATGKKKRSARQAREGVFINKSLQKKRGNAS